MKLLASCVFLAIAALHCVLSVSAATVGLYAPDRYEGIPEMCLLPMDFGYCRAKVKRYYFDMRRMKCATFYFGGCAGNVNNFKTLEECNKICLDSYEDYDAPVYSGRDTETRSRGSSNSSSSYSTNSTVTSSSANAGSNSGNSKNAKYNSKPKTIQNRSDDSKVEYDDYDEN